MEKKKMYYGWPLVVILGLLYFLTSGFILATAQMVNPVMMTVFVLCSAIPAPLVGQLVAKIGSRNTIAACGVIVIILSMVFVRSRPEDMGLEIDGGAVAEKAEAAKETKPPKVF